MPVIRTRSRRSCNFQARHSDAPPRLSDVKSWSLTKSTVHLVVLSKAARKRAPGYRAPVSGMSASPHLHRPQITYHLQAPLLDIPLISIKLKSPTLPRNEYAQHCRALQRSCKDPSRVSTSSRAGDLSLAQPVRIPGKAWHQ